MNAKQLRQILPILHAFAYRGVVEYKPLNGDTWTRINPDTTEFRPELMNPQEWRWTPTMPEDDEIMADYTEAELKSRIAELEAELSEKNKLIDKILDKLIDKILERLKTLTPIVLANAEQ